MGVVRCLLTVGAVTALAADQAGGRSRREWGRVQAVRAVETGPARAAVAAASEQQGVTAVSTVAAGPAVDIGMPGPAVAAVAEEQTATAAVPAGRTGAAGPAVSAVAEQSGVAAVSAGLSRFQPGAAVTAAAEQQAAVAAVLAGSAVGAVADQPAPVLAGIGAVTDPHHPGGVDDRHPVGGDRHGEHELEGGVALVDPRHRERRVPCRVVRYRGR